MQIITTHKSTDFDGLASMVAGTVIYPGIVPWLPKNINPNVKAFLSIHKDVFQMQTIDEIELAEVTRLVVVDTNNWNRLESFDRLQQRENLEIFLWDHHTPGDIEATWECKEEMGANVTLMIRQLKAANLQLTPIQATLLLAGIYEDTGNLTFKSTTAEDAAAVSYLLENKADLQIISNFLRPVYSELQKDVLFKMLKSADRTKVNGHSISFNKIDIDGHIGNLSVVVHMYREILNVGAAFGIFSDSKKDKCIVIGRSNIEELNVGAIMRSMGGGGHPGAGSAMLKSVNPEAIEEWITELIKGNQRSPVQISDLMSFPVISVEPHTTMEDVAALLRDRGCTGVPVLDNGKIVGIISRRDFRKVKKNSQLSAPVKAFMSTNIIKIEPGISPIEAARMMVKYDVGRLPVVEDGKVIGIISRSDAMHYFYDLLPE